ncbi:Aste57867_15462 [Aphanomyces stellatus]|uniref:Aste57867_15462 protein n=1 Tax=Aphanomyces stellatus TaxID=120398 RepID=A0A485L640_9STRA|nr:hypothetical protein As57867_015406 [Aphanomyces stellatus]VFT92264.1 Aste57867_15462 [Aphanomyces stellatus]
MVSGGNSDFVELLQRQLNIRSPRRLLGSKYASVAMIFHMNDDGVAELLFIRRAVNPRDRWSGHIAFPGGRVEKGETPLEAAHRETMEEVGLSLADATCLGHLDDRFATGNVLVVHTFVFLLPVKPTAFTLQTSEVNDAFWVPYAHIATAPVHTLAYPTTRFFPRSLQHSPTFQAIVSAVGLGHVQFPCVHLPHPSMSAMAPRTSASDFILWGLTYSIVLDLLRIHGAARPIVGSATPRFVELLAPYVVAVVLVGVGARYVLT